MRKLSIIALGSVSLPALALAACDRQPSPGPAPTATPSPSESPSGEPSESTDRPNCLLGSQRC